MGCKEVIVLLIQQTKKRVMQNIFSRSFAGMKKNS